MQLSHLLKYLFPLLVLATACTTQPEPLLPGKDVCVFCKMPIADAKFGAELITSKGRIYKYDDAICMINWLNKDENKNITVSRKLVANYSGTSELIDVENAVFVSNEDIRTPMNSGLAAFPSSPEALKVFPFAEQTIKWEQVLISAK